jgi:hypothetical protein
MNLVDETFRIEVTEKFLETFGTGTLMGVLAKLFQFGIPRTVKLVFPQATIGWCRAHNGPPQWIVNEYTIRCLLDDVLKLRELGVDVSLETETRDPPSHDRGPLV